MLKAKRNAIKKELRRVRKIHPEMAQAWILDQKTQGIMPTLPRTEDPLLVTKKASRRAQSARSASSAASTTTKAVKSAVAKANKELKSTSKVNVKKLLKEASKITPEHAKEIQRSIPEEDMNRLQRTAQEIQQVVKTEERIENLKQDATQLPPEAQKERAESLEAETMKLKLHKTWLQRHLPKVDAKLTAHGTTLGAAGLFALSSLLLIGAPVSTAATASGLFLGGTLSSTIADDARDKYFTPETLKQLEEFYEVHDPSSVWKAEHILRNYPARNIVASLRRKYGAIPNGSIWRNYEQAYPEDQAANTLSGGGGNSAAYERAYATYRAMGYRRHHSCLAAMHDVKTSTTGL